MPTNLPCYSGKRVGVIGSGASAVEFIKDLAKLGGNSGSQMKFGGAEGAEAPLHGLCEEPQGEPNIQSSGLNI